MEALCRGKEWATEDPLGIGGLLSDAYRVAQLSAVGGFKQPGLIQGLLESSQTGLDAYARGPQFGLPADYRLAFRELGMTIGLHAVERIEARVGKKPDASSWKHPVSLQLDRLKRHTRLTEEIETFWLDPKNREVSSWADHPDINSVMLATSLAPDGYLHL